MSNQGLDTVIPYFVGAALGRISVQSLWQREAADQPRGTQAAMALMQTTRGTEWWMVEPGRRARIPG